MKRLLLIAAVILVGLTASAQHLTFMGIPIDGNRAHFIRELMFKKDFKKSDFYSKEYPYVQGKFAGDNVLVSALTYGKNKIWRVGVIYDKTSHWSTLKSQFNTIVGNLTEKYGEPISINKDNPEPYTDGSGKEMDGLSRGLVTWKADFLVYPYGYILVYMVEDGKIIVSYTDTINEKKKNDAVQNDL